MFENKLEGLPKVEYGISIRIPLRGIYPREMKTHA
jgi:hypothetical protein